MTQVPDYEEYQALVERVQRLETDNNFLKTLLLGERWLSRKEAMAAIGCGDGKLRQLATHGRLTHRFEGKTPFYCVFSIRNYLASQKFDERVTDNRIIAARLGQNDKWPTSNNITVTDVRSTGVSLGQRHFIESEVLPVISTILELQITQMICQNHNGALSIIARVPDAKLICRFYFEGIKIFLGTYDEKNKRSIYQIATLNDIYAHSQSMIASLKRHLANK